MVILTINPRKQPKFSNTSGPGHTMGGPVHKMGLAGEGSDVPTRAKTLATEK